MISLIYETDTTKTLLIQLCIDFSGTQDQQSFQVSLVKKKEESLIFLLPSAGQQF